MKFTLILLIFLILPWDGNAQNEDIMAVPSPAYTKWKAHRDKLWDFLEELWLKSVPDTLHWDGTLGTAGDFIGSVKPVDIPMNPVSAEIVIYDANRRPIPSILVVLRNLDGKIIGIQNSPLKFGHTTWYLDSGSYIITIGNAPWKKE